MQALHYTLRTAAEAHLGRVICLVDVNLFTTTVTDGHLDRIVDVALSNLGLTRVLESKPDAYALALWAEGWYEVPQRIGEPPNALFLVIESSSCGTINLDLPLLDETGSMNIRRHHNVAPTAIDAKCLNDDGPAGCTALTAQRRRTIREVLTNITRPPFGKLPWAGQMPTTISRIVVYGDAANDAVLQDELLALFGPDLAGASIVQQPIFAVVLGAARQAFFRINDVSYYGTPSTWCCLRSWGKAYPNNKQRIDL